MTKKGDAPAAVWIVPVVIGTGKRFFGDGAIPPAA
jgi:hypothetical protein